MEHLTFWLQPILLGALIGGLIIRFHKPLGALLAAVTKRVEMGSTIKAGPFCTLPIMNSKMKYEKTVVAFLDILGTKDDQEFDSKYKIHRLFHESIRDCQERDRQEAAYYRKLFNFSDCAYIFHGFRPESEVTPETENKLIQVALFNTTIVTLRLLSEGYLVRGGITYGDVYHDELSFFGPAIEEAYLLESKQAVTPRILLETHLGEQAMKFSANAHAEAFSERNPMMKFLPQRSYIPELIKFDRGAYFLNPLYLLEMEGTVNISGQLLTHKEVTDSIILAVDQQIQKHPWESCVRPKLEWMKEYAASSKLSLIHENSSVAFVIEPARP